MGKKIRIYLSTLLTAYHHYQRILKKKRNKIIIMDNLIEAIKQLKKEKNAIILGHYYRRVNQTRHSRLCRWQSGSGNNGRQRRRPILSWCAVSTSWVRDSKVLCPDKRYWCPTWRLVVRLPTVVRRISLHSCQRASRIYGDILCEYNGCRKGCYGCSGNFHQCQTNRRKLSRRWENNIRSRQKPGKLYQLRYRQNIFVMGRACHVHEQFSVEKIVELKQQHPGAVVLAHPECKGTVLKLADVVGSTAALRLKYAVAHPERNTSLPRNRVSCTRCRRNVRRRSLFRHRPTTVSLPVKWCV